MKIDFNQQIPAFDDSPILDAETKQPLTLRIVAVNALAAIYADENADGPTKFKRGALALRISAANDELDLDTEDISLIKLLVGKAYAPLVVLRAYNLLENRGSENK